MTDEYTFTTPCGHSGIIKPVRATGGKYEGHWYSRIKGPRVTGLTKTKTVYSRSNITAALESIARYLRTPSLRIRCHPVATSTSSPSSIQQCERKNPLIQQYGKDVREHSPNGMVRCRFCQKRIKKGEMRVGKWTTDLSFYLSDVPYKPRHLYYRDQCFFESFQGTLNLPNPQIQENRDKLLRSRRTLREQLRMMRMVLSRRLCVPVYCIFPDVTLDDITVRLPQTKSELMACHGIKEKRFRKFGAAILALTEAHATHTMQSGTKDDDTIEVTQTLSIEDIVSKKIQHAEENGYVIEL